LKSKARLPAAARTGSAKDTRLTWDRLRLRRASRAFSEMRDNGQESSAIHIAYQPMAAGGRLV